MKKNVLKIVLVVLVIFIIIFMLKMFINKKSENSSILKLGKYVDENNNYIILEKNNKFEQSIIIGNEKNIYKGKYEIKDYEFIIYLNEKIIYNIENVFEMENNEGEKEEHNIENVYDRYEILDDKSIKQVIAIGNIDNLNLYEYNYKLEK